MSESRSRTIYATIVMMVLFSWWCNLHSILATLLIDWFVNCCWCKTIYQHKDERTNTRRSGPVQILRLHTNQRWNISKRSKDQTGASTLSHDKAGNIVEKQTISFPTKNIPYRSLVLLVLLYGCENWTLTADLERRIQAFENKCYKRMLGILYREHKTNTLGSRSLS